MAGPNEVIALGAAIVAALEGLERAAELVPANEMVWKGRLLRARAEIAREARQRHVSPVPDAEPPRQSAEESTREPRFVRGSRSVA